MVADLLFTLVPGRAACLQLFCVFRLAATKLPKNISKVIAACVVEARTFSLIFSQSQNFNRKQMCGVQIIKKKKKVEIKQNSLFLLFPIRQFLNSDLLKIVMCSFPPYLTYEIHIFLIKFLVNFNSSGLAWLLYQVDDFLDRLSQCPLIGIFPDSLQQLPCSD